MVGHHRQRRQQRQRIEIDDVAALACQRAARHVALADAEAVGEEDQVAFATFGRLGGADIMVDADTGIGRDVGMPPGGEVIAVATQGHADPHLFLAHPVPPVGSMPTRHGTLTALRLRCNEA